MRPADPEHWHAHFLVIKQRGLERGAREEREHFDRIRALKLTPADCDPLGEVRRPKRGRPVGRL